MINDLVTMPTTVETIKDIFISSGIIFEFIPNFPGCAKQEDYQNFPILMYIFEIYSQQRHGETRKNCFSALSDCFVENFVNF